jgi:hypothetical protein
MPPGASSRVPTDAIDPLKCRPKRPKRARKINADQSRQTTLRGPQRQRSSLDECRSNPEIMSKKITPRQGFRPQQTAEAIALSSESQMPRLAGRGPQPATVRHSQPAATSQPDEDEDARDINHGILDDGIGRRGNDRRAMGFCMACCGIRCRRYQTDIDARPGKGPSVGKKMKYHRADSGRIGRPQGCLRPLLYVRCIRSGRRPCHFDQNPYNPRHPWIPAGS